MITSPSGDQLELELCAGFRCILWIRIERQYRRHGNYPGDKEDDLTQSSLPWYHHPGQPVNTVTITGPIGTPDPILANNSATDTDNGPSADWRLLKLMA